MKRSAVIWRLFPLLGIILFLRYPGPVGDGVRAGMALCIKVLIPSLFPVSVLSGFLIHTGAAEGIAQWAERPMQKLFGLPGQAVVPLLLGSLGGFPLGAQLAASAYEDGMLSRQEAARLAGLSTNAGPAFLLGAVSAILASPALGGTLLCIQLISAALTGWILRAPPQTRIPLQQKKIQQVPSLAALPRCISESAVSMLRLTGAVAFFQAIIACVKTVLPCTALPPLWQAGIFGALELTGALAQLGTQHSQAVFPLAAALVCWGGLCVHLQTAQALSASGISAKPYLRHKTIQTVLALLLSSLFFFISK